MDRQRRSPSDENVLWRQPCDFGSDSNSLESLATLAQRVQKQAKNAHDVAMSFKDKFVQLHSLNSYEELLSTWSEKDWLKGFSWLDKEIVEGLPQGNLSYKKSEAYLDKLMSDDIVSHLPSMYKGLKMVVAGLYLIGTEGLNEDIRSDAELKDNINLIMHKARGVLCEFHDVMRSRSLTILPLPNSELPDLKNDKILNAFLVYRDTLNYLEYLADVFEKMSKVPSKI